MSTDSSRPRLYIPNSFQVPNIVSDELLAELSGSEFKVLIYIVRRTFGFNKETDNISLSRMLNGLRDREDEPLRDKEGRILDLGVGLTKKPLLAALRSLQERRLISTVRRRSLERGDEPTTYRLTLAEWQPEETESASTVRDNENGSGEHLLPVGEKLHHGGGGEVPPGGWGRNSTTQNPLNQNPGIQNPPSSNGLEGDISQKSNDKPSFSRKRDIPKLHIHSAAPESPQREKRAAPMPIGQVLEGRVHVPIPETVSEPRRSPRSGFSGDPGTVSQPTPRRGRPPKATEQIAALITQFSAEFHDEDSERPNISQAARLWKESGLPEDAFCQRLFEARSITKRYDIEKRAEGEAGRYGARNKMPYFFKVLRDVLGMREATDHRPYRPSSPS